MWPGLYAAEEILPTPEEIIAKNIEARGGIKALKKIKTRKIVYSIKGVGAWNFEAKETIYQERPDKYHTSEDMMGSNGETVWTNGPPVGTLLIEGDDLATLLREHLFDGPDGPDARYKSMKTAGVEQINGKDCYKVVKTPEKGPERIVYYDKKSYLIVKYINGTGAGPINGTGERNLFEYYIEEYQKIDNILVPYKIVRMFRGQRESETTVEVEHNIEMPEGIFDIPEEIKAIMDKK